MSTTMRAAVFQGKGKIGLREVPRPGPGVGEALVRVTRFPFRDLVTHPFRLDDIESAYDLFAHQRDGVMKVAIRP